MNKVCIIVPCYNEEKRLPVQEFQRYIHSSEADFCFVNDGSSDKTDKVLENLKAASPESISVLNLPKNVGKAEAVRQGFLHLFIKDSYDYIGYFDADLATPLYEIDSLLQSFSFSDEIKMAFGSRVQLLGRQIERSLLRHYFGRFFATAASLILRLPVYDTQCGAKIIDAKLATKLFSKPFLSPWLFDIEVMARICKLYSRKQAKKMLFEVPLFTWIEVGESRIKLKHLLKVPIELFKIYIKYR